MYSRVTLLEIDTVRSTTDAAADAFRSEVLPELREQEGFEGFVLLANEEGRGMVMTLWDTEEHAFAPAPTAFYASALERFVTLFKSPPGRERYEVVDADVPAFMT